MSTLTEKLRAKAVALGWVAATPEGAPNPNEGREAIAMTLSTDMGDIETPFNDVAVGDVVTMADGTPAPAGTYTVSDGTIFEIGEGGVVDSITPAPEGDLETMVVALQQEIAELKTAIAEKDEALNASQFAIDKLEAKATRSTYKPQSGAVATFRQAGNGSAKTSVTKEALKEARANYKPVK